MIEQMIQDKGLSAPRVTPEEVEANIAGTYYFTALQGVQQAFHEQDELSQVSGIHGDSLSLLTICVIVLKNGFTVTGESACASPENFDPEIGRTIAFREARDKIWPLMGYNLKQKLHDVHKLREAMGTAD